MKEFLGDDFLLDTDMARRLYHRYCPGSAVKPVGCVYLLQKEFILRSELKQIEETI